MTAAERITRSPMSDAARRTLDEWHRIVAANDPDALAAIFAPDIVFRSPFVWKPYHGRAAAMQIIRTVFTVFEDFRYHRTFANPTGCVLEFSAHVGDRHLFGVDLIEFDEAGMMVDFTVMIRPGTGLEAVASAMAKRLAMAGAPA